MNTILETLTGSPLACDHPIFGRALEAKFENGTWRRMPDDPSTPWVKGVWYCDRQLSVEELQKVTAP